MDNIKIDISREEAKELLDFYEAKRQQFIESNRAIFNKLKEHNDRIAKLKKILEGKIYPIQGSWNDKIQFVLNQHPAGLTARQVSELIIVEEGLPKEQINQLYGSIAPTLSQNTNKLYDRDPNANNDYVYSIKK